jgi:hypothetical protein
MTSDASEPDAAPDATADATFDAGTDAGRGDGQVASAGEASASTAGDSSATPTNAMPDVSFTPDGSYALVRQQGIAAISVVSLVDGSATRVGLPVAPTDLTISPDGAFAVAVLRDTSSVAILPLPAIATDPNAYTTTTIAGETIGRALVTTVASAGPPSILLFTTASPVERMTTLTLGPTPSYRTIPLHAPVLAVFPTDDGRYAIVLHSVSPSSGTVKGAFSVVPIADPIPGVIVSLAAPPTAVAIATDRALVALRDDTTSTYGVDLAMMPSLHVTSLGLASPPIAVGIAAATATGYVAQNYSEGRITFIDLDAGATRTITGFELGARVVTGNGQ